MKKVNKKLATEFVAELQKAADVAAKRGRFVYYIPEDGYVEGRGWRVAIVFENEAGYHMTGDTPEGGEREPWFWGRQREDLELAQRIAREKNEERGIGIKDEFEIITSSMARGRP